MVMTAARRTGAPGQEEGSEEPWAGSIEGLERLGPGAASGPDHLSD